MHYKDELKIATKAALTSAEIIQKLRNNNDFEIKFKAKNDLVTNADVASEKNIIGIIKEAYPDDQILAEESAQGDILTDQRTWIIDPIDGTTNFAHGFPVYCISIALWEAKKPKVGLVYEVANKEMFWATENGGAWLNGEKITISDNTDPSQALIATGFPYSNADLLDEYLNLLKAVLTKTHGVRRPGSAAWDLCNVACGRVDAFYEYGLKPWDIAAATLIVKEAGGKVYDWNGKQDWLFGQRIVAGTEIACNFLLDEIGKVF